MQNLWMTDRMTTRAHDTKKRNLALLYYTTHLRFWSIPMILHFIEDRKKDLIKAALKSEIICVWNARKTLKGDIKRR